MYRVITYVTVPASDNWRWIGTEKPGNPVVSEVDTRYVTHINFAFGMIAPSQFEPGKPGCPRKEAGVASKEAYRDPTDGRCHYRASVTGWIEEVNTQVDGSSYLKALVALKQKKPELKVLLSIGGWNADGFCYMSGTQEGRSEFIESCISLIREYSLDGIDIDWEYPTNGGWGRIASCPSCVRDARLLVQEFRVALDHVFPKEHKLLSIASGMGQPWADSDTLDALDYMNVMCYDYEPGTGGSQAGMEWARPGMERNTELAGDTPEHRRKINMGIPFYNEAGEYLVPYRKEWNGHVDASPEITAEKMKWVKENGYGGAFYWAYSMDLFEEDVEDPKDPRVKCLQRAVYENLQQDPE